MDFATLLGNVQRRPGAYGLDGSYREFVAFVNGCDARQDWLLLNGFREWLAERLGRGANLVWWELVRQICLAEWGSAAGEPEDTALSARMFELLGEFLAAKRPERRPYPSSG
ncbi:hypothetical protein [Actinophytocola sp.]|uniref:hypothetical protein n=1 Tax=Actinophytocola sp. TaxID=1872138 RepID=UPI002D7ECBEA|nr:hypothetical protein [Actinophytocola sp.]HET9142308.1 hypothetical protein [Actinophytocola sp.]